MQNTTTFLANSFTPSGASPLVLPSSSLFAGTKVDTAASALVGGTITNVYTSPSTSLYYVDPTDLNNINDPMRGKWIVRRDVPIYARAKVTASSGPPIYSYVREKISVRGAALFAHAIFFNMDMELFPGPTMNVSGPVHANGDIFSVNASGNTPRWLNYLDTVTCTGNFYHTHKITTCGNSVHPTNDVTFMNRLGTSVSQVSADAGGTWKDSTMGASTTIWANLASYTTEAAYLGALRAAATTNANAFRTFAATTWHGSLQTVVNGVQRYNGVAFEPYVEDPTPYDGVDQSRNSARMIIEPPLAVSNSEYNAQIEEQKFSTKAGVYIKIVPASGYTNTTSLNTPSSGKTTVTTNAPSIAAIVTVRVGGASGTLATSLPAGLVTYYPYKQTAVTTVSTGATTYTVNSSMYDQHRDTGIDLVQLDITKLKAAVAAIGTTSSTAIVPLAASHWTGVVYLEVTSNPTTRINGTTIAAAGGAKVAIRLVNGNVQVPSYGASEGLTIATNAPVYIKGNFNDTTATGASGTVPRTGEPPACIAADAITLLSAGFVDSTSRTVVNWGPSMTVAAPGASMVVAAALLTGVVISNKDGNALPTVGAQNLVGLLENWTIDNTVTLRGSLVGLFESRIATTGSDPVGHYFSAPTRNFGFCDLLKNGRYPPGTPRVMSYRRVDYTDLTTAEYDAAIAGL
jgi:hypothetical protein